MTARFQCRECTCWFPGEGEICDECLDAVTKRGNHGFFAVLPEGAEPIGDIELDPLPYGLLEPGRILTVAGLGELDGEYVVLPDGETCRRVDRQ